jgi:AAA domain
MTEATGVEAKTIHRLLEVDPKSGGFKRNSDNPLDCDLLVVDEASVVDVMLMQALVKAIRDKAALLIVGDIDQLPSVGPGQVLADIATSRTIINAPRINQGAMPGLSAPAGDSDLYFVPAEDPETAVPRIVELVKTRIPKRFGLNSVRDIQVLCPMNRGGVGRVRSTSNCRRHCTPRATARSNVSDGRLRRAIRSCRSKMTTTRKSAIRRHRLYRRRRSRGGRTGRDLRRAVDDLRLRRA